MKKKLKTIKCTPYKFKVGDRVRLIKPRSKDPDQWWPEQTDEVGRIVTITIPYYYPHVGNFYQVRESNYVWLEKYMKKISNTKEIQEEYISQEIARRTIMYLRAIKRQDKELEELRMELWKRPPILTQGCSCCRCSCRR